VTITKKFKLREGLETQNISFVNANTSFTLEAEDNKLDIIGTAGELFSIQDTLDGVIFSVTNSDELPFVEIESAGTIRLAELAGQVLIGQYDTLDPNTKLQVTGGLSADNITGPLTGNATTATRLQTARTISLAGGVSGFASFDGSSNITISATVADNSHNHIISNITGLQTALDGKLSLTGGTLTGDLTIPDKIIHAGDTDTAIRFPANDTFTIETAGAERFRVDSVGNVGIGVVAPSAKLDVVGDIEVNSNIILDSETTTLATTTKTQIASFPAVSFRSGKFIVQAYDSVTGEVHISELLVVHNGTTASATEYGIVHTGADPLAAYDVDIDTGNVRLLATGATANSTQYKISETLMVA
jgi:hypothetical protein